MCHNHSHAKADPVGSTVIKGVLHGIFLLDQRFTIETQNGGRLILSAGSIFLIPFSSSADLSAFLALVTGELSAFTQQWETGEELSTVIGVTRLTEPPSGSPTG